MEQHLPLELENKNERETAKEADSRNTHRRWMYSALQVPATRVTFQRRGCQDLPWSWRYATASSPYSYDATCMLLVLRTHHTKVRAINDCNCPSLGFSYSYTHTLISHTFLWRPAALVPKRTAVPSYPPRPGSTSIRLQSLAAS